MDKPSSEIAYPTIEQIIDANRRLTKETGGIFLEPNNLRNESSLQYILSAISESVYGVELYPTIKEKATALACNIITSHVFNDGNKRTAIFIATLFLKSNHININLDKTVEELAVDIASNEADNKDLLDWLHRHQ